MSLPQRGYSSGRYTPDKLRWHSVGPTRPVEGRELTNGEMAAKLSSATLNAVYTQIEWQKFGIEDLSADDFIRSADGKLYFQPDSDDRTADEKGLFGKGLKSLNLWYVSRKVCVLMLTGPLPEDAENKTDYNLRGWYCAPPAPVHDDGVSHII